MQPLETARETQLIHLKQMDTTATVHPEGVVAHAGSVPVPTFHKNGAVFASSENMFQMNWQRLEEELVRWWSQREALAHVATTRCTSHTESLAVRTCSYNSLDRLERWCGWLSMTRKEFAVTFIARREEHTNQTTFFVFRQFRSFFLRPSVNLNFKC